MMTLMGSMLCETTTTPGAVLVRATSSAPPWSDANILQQELAVNVQTASSPDAGQSDAASNSSYIISSSSLIDTGPNSHGLLIGNHMQTCGDMDTRDSSPQSTSYDGYDSQHSMKKNHNNKPHRDPTSHRIIEKRRRDRMNNCLANLSKLIPSAYLKKGRGRIEKTEIIEMAIRYMKHTELERRQLKREHTDLQEELMLDKSVGTEETEGNITNGASAQSCPSSSTRTFGEKYKQGFFDCIAETLRFLAGAEGLMVDDQMKTRLLFHLREYFGKLADSAYPIQQSTAASHEKMEDTLSDEPLNMSLKRPRVDSTHGRVPLSQQSSSVEMPSSSSVISSAGEMGHQGGSQLRDILETREPTVSKHPIGQQRSTPLAHLPQSAMPSIFMQHKLANSMQTMLATTPVCGMDSSSDRSLSGLLGGSGGGGRSTTSSNGTTTSHYPSSPGSSVNSYLMESPPGLHSPPLPMSHLPPTNRNGPGGFPVPIFALHPIGLFYVPLTVDSHLLDQTFNASILLCSAGGAENGGQGGNGLHQLTTAAMSSITHPVTINVNFNFMANMSNAVAQTMAHREHGRGANRNGGVILTGPGYAPNLRSALKH